MRFMPLLVLVFFITGCSRPTTPISVELHLDNAVEGLPWTLKVDPSGNAKLDVGSPPKISKSFVVTSWQMYELRTVLEEENFFRMKNEYGYRIPGATNRTIIINDGNRQKTVRIGLLADSPNIDVDTFLEPAPALRVWRCVNSWFHERDAANMSKNDDKILYAVTSSDSYPVNFQQNLLQVQ